MFGIPTEALFGTVTAIASFGMKFMACKAEALAEERKYAHASAELQSAMYDAAASRSSPWVRKYLAVFVVTAVIASIIYAGFTETDVWFVRDIPQNSFLFGLFKWGETTEIIKEDGLYQPDWIKFLIYQIAGFFFGSGLAKGK